jgi:hypothetical protein
MNSQLSGNNSNPAAERPYQMRCRVESIIARFESPNSIQRSPVASFGELHAMESGVVTVLRQQLCVSSDLDYLPGMHHYDAVGLLNRR